MSRRVLVVEDSITVRKRLVEVLSADPELEVVGEAGDGKKAIDLCERLRPDVITLDMVLPVLSGVAVTEIVMAYHPTPILIVSSSTNRGELFRTYDALAAGAIDVLEKPRIGEESGAWEQRLVAAVKTASRVKVITHIRGRLARMAQAAAPGRAAPPPARSAGAPRAGVVAIGGSTGAPGALVEILRSLPPTFAATVLLVVHINEPFGAAFAEWLDAQSRLRVRYPRRGERVRDAGCVLMAPPGRHLAVGDGVVELDDGPERHSCKPSVDVLFESLARQPDAPAMAACLLTGMGRDGAAGLLALRRAGAFTIAQDEASCAVYGMPREAVLLGAADQVLALSEIGPALADLTGARRELA